MISSEESQHANDEIGSQVYLLAMKLKRNKNTKQIEQAPTKAAKPTAIESTDFVPASPSVSSKRIVKIDFIADPTGKKCFDMDVEPSNVFATDLIGQVQAKLDVSRTFDFCCFHLLVTRNWGVSGLLNDWFTTERRC